VLTQNHDDYGTAARGHWISAGSVPKRPRIRTRAVSAPGSVTTLPRPAPPVRQHAAPAARPCLPRQHLGYRPCPPSRTAFQRRDRQAVLGLQAFAVSELRRCQLRPTSWPDWIRAIAIAPSATLRSTAGRTGACPIRALTHPHTTRAAARTPQSRTTAPAIATRALGAFGCLARAVALVLAGVFLGKAGVLSAPGQAKGLDAIFRSVASSHYGPWLLAPLASGLLRYGLYC
jgi:Domain of Unknown Function (DUF1206)